MFFQSESRQKTDLQIKIELHLNSERNIAFDLRNKKSCFKPTHPAKWHAST